MSTVKHEHVAGVSFALVLGAFATGGFIAGIPALLIYLGLAKRHKLDPFEGATGIFTVMADSATGIADSVRHVPKAVDSVQKIVKGQKPLLPSLKELRAQNDEKAIAIKRANLLRSAIIVAPQKSGKTRYLLDDVQAFLEAGEGQLYICDPNYGSAHDGEAPNTWFDLPLDEYVFDTEKACLDVIKLVSGIVDKRQNVNRQNAKAKVKQDIKHEPILLLVDEESMVNSFIGEDQELRSQFVEQVRNLLQRGHKQNVFIKLVCHDTTTATTGLPQAMFAQVDVILLGAAALHDKYLSQCGIDKAIASEVRQMRETNERAYIAKIQGEVTVNPMPFISEPNFSYEVDNSDPWMDEWVTEERVQQLNELPDNARIKEDVAMGVFGLTASRCRNSNEDYVRIKEVWAEMCEMRISGIEHDDTEHQDSE